MSVLIEGVEKGSPAFKAGIKAGDTLVSINNQDIVDVLDYRFYQNDKKLLPFEFVMLYYMYKFIVFQHLLKNNFNLLW